MDRKKALVAATTVAGSLLAASTAYALTSGVVSGRPDDGAGNLSPVVDAPAAHATTAPTTASSPGANDDPSATVHVYGDDEHGTGDDDTFERVDGDGDKAGEPSHYEGRDDDD